MPDTSSLNEAPWKAGLRSARANLVPGLLLQAFALIVVLGYYFYEPSRSFFSQLTEWRTRIGLLFDILSTGFFGGVIPLLYLKSTHATRDQLSWKQGWVLAAFWAYKGFEVGLWYAFMARIIGDSADVRTIAAKAVLDQFIYCPIVAIPITTLVYYWTQQQFSIRAVIADLRVPRWYARRVLPLLFANFGVWLPLVCIIYAMPSALQLPLQNIVLCFFTLMLAHMSRRPASHQTQE